MERLNKKCNHPDDHLDILIKNGDSPPLCNDSKLVHRRMLNEFADDSDLVEMINHQQNVEASIRSTLEMIKPKKLFTPPDHERSYAFKQKF